MYIMNPFNAACLDEDLEKVKSLVNQYGDRDRKEGLFTAVRLENLELVKYLIESRVIESRGDIHADRDYALRTACMHGHLEIVQYLVENAANIHVLNDYPLNMACEGGHLKVVKYLVEKGANISGGGRLFREPTVIFLNCVERGQLELVKYFVEGCKEHTDMRIDIHYNDECALFVACNNGRLEVAKYLLEKGANMKVCLAWDSIRYVRHVTTNIYLSSVYPEIFTRGVGKKHTCFYDLLYFFYYQEDHEEKESEIWDGNIGLIVASMTWK